MDEQRIRAFLGQTNTPEGVSELPAEAVDDLRRTCTLLARFPPPCEQLPAILVLTDARSAFWVPLTHPVFSVGRSPQNDLSIDESAVSRQHCSFVEEAGAWSVCDLGSRNGTMFRDSRVSRHALRSGDVLRLGTVMLVFVDAVAVPAPAV